MKLVLSGSWTKLVLGCSIFQYSVGGNEPIPSLFSLFLVNYLEKLNVLDTLKPLLLVLVLIYTEFQYC